MKTTVPKSDLERGVVFGVRFIFVWTTVPESGLKRRVVRFIFYEDSEESVRFIFYEDYSS